VRQQSGRYELRDDAADDRHVLIKDSFSHFFRLQLEFYQPALHWASSPLRSLEFDIFAR